MELCTPLLAWSQIPSYAMLGSITSGKIYYIIYRIRSLFWAWETRRAEAKPLNLRWLFPPEQDPRQAWVLEWRRQLWLTETWRAVSPDRPTGTAQFNGVVGPSWVRTDESAHVLRGYLRECHFAVAICFSSSPTCLQAGLHSLCTLCHWFMPSFRVAVLFFFFWNEWVIFSRRLV